LNADAIKFARELADLMKRYPSVGFAYGTDDDGVWIESNGKCQINIGFNSYLADGFSDTQAGKLSEAVAAADRASNPYPQKV
jgi:hypothetical protein